MSLLGRLLSPASSSSSPLSVVNGVGSVRCYIRHFWAEKQHYPFPGFMHHGKQAHFQHNKLRIQNNPNPKSEIQRLRKLGWEKRMSTRAGRKIIMDRMLQGKYFLAEV